MKHSKQRNLEKDVRQLLKDRSQPVRPSRKRIVSLKALAWASLWVASVLFLNGYNAMRMEAGFTASVMYDWLLAVNYVLFSFLLFLYAQIPPVNEADLDMWLLKRGRRTLLLFTTILMVQIASQMLPADITVFGRYRVMAAIGYVGYGIFFCTVIAVLARPELFVSERITTIASSCFALAVATAPVRIVAAFQPSAVTVWNTVLLSLPLIAAATYQQLRPKSLNIVQFTVLYIINPARLLTALRSHNRVIQDQYNALLVKTRLERNLSLGVQKELVQLIVKENKSTQERLWWFIPIVGFILAAIGESLIQDLLYERIIRPLLCRVLSTLCP